VENEAALKSLSLFRAAFMGKFKKEPCSATPQNQYFLNLSTSRVKPNAASRINPTATSNANLLT
jgi:hypothetical protein